MKFERKNEFRNKLFEQTTYPGCSVVSVVGALNYVKEQNIFSQNLFEWNTQKYSVILTFAVNATAVLMCRKLFLEVTLCLKL